MKRILSLLMLSTLALTTAWAGKMKFTVQGTAPRNAKQIAVYDMATHKPLTFLNVSNGTFTYSNTVPNETLLLFYEQNSDTYSYLIIDKEEIQLDMQRDQVTGSPLTEQLLGINDTLNTLMKKQKAEAIQYLESVVKRHPKDCLPAIIIERFCEMLPFETLSSLCKSKAAYTNHPMFDRVKKKYAMDSKYIGKKFTNATLHNGRGEKVKLSEAIGKGKYVLVDFWASWCGPCMNEMPYLKECYAKYKDKGFEIVGISLDRNRSAWINAIAQKELTWQHYSDLDQFNNEAAATYEVKSIPWNFLCDPEGTIIAISLRGEALAYKLAEVMK
ncbi:MAG: AhpC/TSA family protein [Bacteroidales bacterium]|nr:AhpC/TSA family protein [Bacteroidales bacterium]